MTERLRKEEEGLHPLEASPVLLVEFGGYSYLSVENKANNNGFE